MTISEDCPFIGLPEDARTHYAFPVSSHLCHAKGRAVRLDLHRQRAQCLAPAYRTCPLYVPHAERLAAPRIHPAPSA